VWAADDIRKEPMQFKKGTSSATVKGRIQGYQAVDYVLCARAGGVMSVSMKTNNGANYFNVLPPGSDAAILTIASMESLSMYYDVAGGARPRMRTSSWMQAGARRGRSRARLAD
jgi:hypothetical protein